jgi:hypothetical protein
MMLEKDLEKKIVNKAKQLGFLSYKFVSPSQRGVPDRIFISKNGKVFFIEFKSPKRKITPVQKELLNRWEMVKKDVFKSKLKNLLTSLQIDIILDLTANKADVFVVNNEKLGLEILTKIMSED